MPAIVPASPIIPYKAPANGNEPAYARFSIHKLDDGSVIKMWYYEIATRASF